MKPNSEKRREEKRRGRREREKWMTMEREKEGESVFSIRVNLARQFGPPFQRPNGRWTVMDSACGLLINLGEAIGEPLSTCSKLNKAYPEMALFSLNSPCAPLSSADPLPGIRANKMGKFQTLWNHDGYLPHIQEEKTTYTLRNWGKMKSWGGLRKMLL